MMDPILTPMFVSIGISPVIGNILVGFVLAAGAVALAMLFAPPLPKPDDVKFPIQQNIPPRGFGYGTARVSGYFMLKVAPDKGGVLYQVQALVSHPINDLIFIYLHDDQVDPSTAPGGQIEARPELGLLYGGTIHNTEAGVYGDNRVFVDWRYANGDEATTYWITGEVGTIGDLWPSTSKGYGIASMAFKFRDSGADEQHKRFPNGPPEPSAVVDLISVYDPRPAAGHDIDDPDTWEFSRNPVLCIIHWLCFSEFGFQCDYDEAILPLESEWIAAANVCDEAVDVFGGGDQPRYECGGYGTTENEPVATLAQMLAACDGWLALRGDGAYVIRVGQFEASGVELTYEDITGFQYQRGVGDEEAINQLDVEFNSPSHNWTNVQADSWVDSADQTARGRIRAQTYPLDWVQDYRRARRIARREWTRLRQPLRGSLDLRLSGLNAGYERWIYLGDTKIPGLSNVYIENRAARFNLAGGGLKLDFVVVDPDDLELWEDTEFYEGRTPAVLVASAPGEPAPPANVDAYLESFEAGLPPETFERIVVQFDIPVDELEEPERNNYRIRYRVADADTITAGDQPGPWTTEPHSGDDVEYISASRVELRTGAVVADELLEVEIASVNSKGTVSDWSPPVDVASGTGADVLSNADDALLQEEDLDILTE